MAAVMAKLKLTADKRTNQAVSVEDGLRNKLMERLSEQLKLAEATLAGKAFTLTRTVYVTNEAGERVTQEVPRRLRKWFWHNGEGTWFIELRYGGKVMKISGDKAAIEAGELADVPKTITTVMEAVKAGELDKALLAAKKERMAILRRKR